MSLQNFFTKMESFSTTKQAILYLILIALALMILEPVFAYFVVSVKKRELERKMKREKGSETKKNQP